MYHTPPPNYYVAGQITLHKEYKAVTLMVNSSQHFQVSLNRSPGDVVICCLYGTDLTDQEELDFKTSVSTNSCKLTAVSCTHLGNGSMVYSVVLTVKDKIINSLYPAVKVKTKEYAVGNSHEMQYAGRVDNFLLFRPKMNNLHLVVTKSRLRYQDLDSVCHTFFQGQAIFYHSNGRKYRACVAHAIEPSFYIIKLVDLPFTLKAHVRQLEVGNQQGFKEPTDSLMIKVAGIDLPTVVNLCKQEFQEVLNSQGVYRVKILSKGLAQVTGEDPTGKLVDIAVYLSSALEKKQNPPASSVSKDAPVACSQKILPLLSNDQLIAFQKNAKGRLAHKLMELKRRQAEGQPINVNTIKSMECALLAAKTKKKSKDKAKKKLKKLNLKKC